MSIRKGAPMDEKTEERTAMDSVKEEFCDRVENLLDSMLYEPACRHASEQRSHTLRREREREHHRHFLIPSHTPLTSISDIVLSWSHGEWLIIDGHSYHPDFYINWRLRKLIGAVMSGKVYRALGPDGEVYRVEGWEIEHKEGV
jgi:hypothetical protein